ncbi:unnamed protein product [Effrenium voratum]|nr:unnamed protein product [Effrenium voratum]
MWSSSKMPCPLSGQTRPPSSTAGSRASASTALRPPKKKWTLPTEVPEHRVPPKSAMEILPKMQRKKAGAIDISFKEPHLPIGVKQSSCDAQKPSSYQECGLAVQEDGDECKCFTYVVPFNLKTTLYLDKLMAWMKLPARAFMYGQMKYWSVPINENNVDFFCDREQEDCQFQVSFSENAKVLQWSWFGEQEKPIFTPEGMAIGSVLAFLVFAPIVVSQVSAGTRILQFSSFLGRCESGTARAALAFLRAMAFLLSSLRLGLWKQSIARSGQEWGGVEMSWKWGGGETSEEEWRGVGRSGVGVEMSWKWGGGEKSEEEWRGVERSGEEWRGVWRSGEEWRSEEEWRGVERSGEEWRGVERLNGAAEVRCADNTGIIKAVIIGLGQNKWGTGKIGDRIRVSAFQSKLPEPFSSSEVRDKHDFYKGEQMPKAIIARTRKERNRPPGLAFSLEITGLTPSFGPGELGGKDGSYIKFDENAFVVISKNKAKGSKIKGPLSYEIQNNCGEFNAELEVQLSQMDGSEPKAEVEDRKQEAVASAKDAKEYLENHQVLQFVQAVLQTVIKERPSDPFEYMARHFMNGYSAQEAIKLCAKKEMTAAQPAPADPLPEPAAAEKKTEEAAPAEAAKETPAVEPQAAAEEPAAVAEMPAPEPAAAEEKIKEAAPMEAAKEMPAAEPQAAAEVPAAVAETPAPEPPAVEEKTEEVAPAEAAKEMPVVEPQASAEETSCASRQQPRFCRRRRMERWRRC